MSAPVDQMKSTMDRISTASESNDGAAVASFFVDDGTLISPFGERADGRAAIASIYSAYFGGMLRDSSTTFTLDSVRPVDNNHAFVDGEQTIHAPDGTVVLVVHLAVLMRHDSDGWRMVDARPYTFASRPA